MNQINGEEVVVGIINEYRFNPLNRGNLNQIVFKDHLKAAEISESGFNPLNRRNLNQIRWRRIRSSLYGPNMFQSPKSGKFESNKWLEPNVSH